MRLTKDVWFGIELSAWLEGPQRIVKLYVGREQGPLPEDEQRVVASVPMAP